MPLSKVSIYLTPHKIVIVMLCMIYCENGIASKHKVSLMSEIIKFIDGDGEDGSYSEVNSSLAILHDNLKNVDTANSSSNGTSIYYELQERLWQLESLDDLYDFFEGVDTYLVHDEEEKAEQEEADIDHQVPMRVMPSSILGSFFRKCVLAFKELNFDQTAQFWKAFKLYRASNGLEHEDADAILPHTETIVDPPSLYIASENLDNLMEHYSALFASQGALLPENLKQKLQELIDSEQNLPASAYFVQYLDACHNRDYEQAFDYLHRFYDYSMDSRGRTHYQYALFTLAILQAEFGSTNEALRAAQEAISVARENMDNTCLTQIMSWLYSYLQNGSADNGATVAGVEDLPKPLASMDQMAVFLLQRSNETSHHLYSLACQSEALRVMSRGEPLTLAFENLVKSGCMNSSFNASTEPELCLVKSTLWSRCGIHVLSDMYLDMCDIPDQSLVSGLQARARKARQNMMKGEIDQAFDQLLSLKQQADKSVAYEHVWLPPFLLLHAKRTLNENKLEEARVILQQLESCSCDMELRHEMVCLQTVLDMMTGNHSDALAKVTRAIEEQRSLTEGSGGTGGAMPDIMYQVRYMLLYVRVIISSSVPSRALSTALRSFSLAERCGIVPLALEALVLVSHILTTQGNHHEPAEIIDSIMPKIYETGITALIAEAYEVLSYSMGDESRLRRHPEQLKNAHHYSIKAAWYYEKENNLARLERVCNHQVFLEGLLVQCGISATTQVNGTGGLKIEGIAKRLKERLKLNAAASVL